MNSASDGPVTADQLLHMPERVSRLELVRGRVKRRPFRGAMEGRLGAALAVRLHQHVERCDLGTVYAAGTGFLLASGPDTVLAPALAFVRHGRPDAASEGFPAGAPDLAVEIASSDDTAAAAEERARTWLGAGAGMVLCADPWKRRVTVYRFRDDIRVLGEDGVLDGGDVVPGWSMQVGELFD